MSHHYSGPNLAFPHEDARLDFTDLFVFPKPGGSSKTILIMDVHPSVGLNPPGPTVAEPFAPNALYEILIDTNGDLIADVTYSVRFTPSTEGQQTATLRRSGEIIVDEAPVSIIPDPIVTNAGEYHFFAGWRSDPFFFDTMGALNNLQFTGQDFFTDKDVCSIALAVPNSELGSRKLNLWARTVDGASGNWVQADRGSHASQEPFLAGDATLAYLSAEPANDAQFIPVFAHALQHTGGYTAEEATRVASTVLLPDVLPYQPGREASYPSNGRALIDDAGGYFLSILTNGRTNGGGLRPHTDLLADFPFVGPPHYARVSTMA